MQRDLSFATHISQGVSIPERERERERERETKRGRERVL